MLLTDTADLTQAGLVLPLEAPEAMAVLLLCQLSLSPSILDKVVLLVVPEAIRLCPLSLLLVPAILLLVETAAVLLTPR